MSYVVYEEYKTEQRISAVQMLLLIISTHLNSISIWWGDCRGHVSAIWTHYVKKKESVRTWFKKLMHDTRETIQS